jgi:hypothetical protein
MPEFPTQNFEFEYDVDAEIARLRKWRKKEDRGSRIEGFDCPNDGCGCKVKFFPDRSFTLRATYPYLADPLPPRHRWGPPAALRFTVAVELRRENDKLTSVKLNDEICLDRDAASRG